MAITPIPTEPLNNITPFTYRDGYTYLQVLEKFRAVINEVIVRNNELDAKINQVLADINNQFLAIQTELERQMAVLAQEQADVNAAVERALVTVDQAMNDAIASFQTVLDNVANVSFTEGAAWNVVTTIVDGQMHIKFTVPVNDPSWWNHSALTDGQNLNTVSAPGVYQLTQVPTDYAAMNMPAVTRGILTVYPFISDTSFSQTWTTWENEPKVFIRTLTNGTWSAWSMVGSGSSALSATANFNDFKSPGQYAMSDIPTDWATQNLPANVRGVLNVIGMNSTSACIQMYTTWEESSKIYVRQWSSSGWNQWSAVGSGSTRASVDTDLNTLTSSGNYSVTSFPTDWVGQNFPANVRGVLTTLGMNTANAMIQEFVTLEPSPRSFVRQYYAGVWSPWKDLSDTGSNGNVTASVNKSPAGFKRVGVPITAGHSGSDAPLSGSVRMPLLYSANIVRFRLRIQNINPRSGITRNGSVTFTGFWLGAHSGNGVMASARQLMSETVIDDTSKEWVTPWFTPGISRGIEYLLTFGYEASGEIAPWLMLGTSYRTSNPDDAATYNPDGMSSPNTVPFTIALECEVKSETPVIASMGDSNSVGVGTTKGLHDSWLSQLCRRVSALPDHRGSSGDTMAGSIDSTGYKWTRFDDLTRPDAIIFELGQNDAGTTNKTLATMQNDFAVTIANASELISDNVYLTNLAPRTVEPWAGFESLRRDYNAWVSTLPAGRDLFDISASLSSDDESLDPGKGAADGIHWTTAGNAAVQAVFDRPIVASMA